MELIENIFCHACKTNTMFTRVIPDLISLASMSMMTSKHAAAIIYGKRVLSMANNYSLPAGEIVDLAIKSTNCGGTGGHVEYPSQHQRYPVWNNQRKYFFDARYEKGPKIEESNPQNWIGARTSC